MQPGNRREEREDEIVQAGDEMIKSLRIVKKGGRVLCCNCGGKVRLGWHMSGLAERITASCAKVRERRHGRP